MQKREFETIKNAFEISRSCQNFPRPTFFEVPFATPTVFPQIIAGAIISFFASKGSDHLREAIISNTAH